MVYRKNTESTEPATPMTDDQATSEAARTAKLAALTPEERAARDERHAQKKEARVAERKEAKKTERVEARKAERKEARQGTKAA